MNEEEENNETERNEKFEQTFKHFIEAYDELAHIYGYAEFDGWKNLKVWLDEIAETMGAVGLAWYGQLIMGTVTAYLYGLCDAGYITKERLDEAQEKVAELRKKYPDLYPAGE